MNCSSIVDNKKVTPHSRPEDRHHEQDVRRQAQIATA